MIQVEPSLWQALVSLFSDLGQVLRILASLIAGWTLLIVWIVWWLWGVNWNKCWDALARGAWAPAVLLMLIAALVWSRLQPAPCECLGFVSIPNFWWQLGEVGMFVAIAFFCGWLQGLYHWAPAEMDLNPPAPSHDHAHH